MLSKNVILLLFALLSHVLTLNAQSDSINVVESVIKKDNYNLAEMSMSWAWSDQLSTYFTSCSDLYVIEYLYDLDLLEMKIDKEKDLNILDLACRCNKRKFLKKILKTEPVDVALYERGPTPMMILAKYGKRRLLRKRIKSSKSINKTGPLRKTALFYSVKRNDIKTTKLLLRKGADPSHLDLTNRTPIHYALLNDNVKLAKLLYSRCIDCDTLKGSILRSAARVGVLDFIKIMNIDSTDINEKDYGKSTALHSSASFSNFYNVYFREDSLCCTDLNFNQDKDVQLFRYLIERGLDVNVLNEDKETILFEFISNYYAFMLFVEQGLEINIKNKEGKSLLSVLVKDFVEDFPIGTDEDGVIDFYMEDLEPERTCQLKIIKLIDEKGIEVPVEFSSALEYVVFASVATGKVKLVQFLMKSNIDVALVSEIGISTLDYARDRGDKEMARLLRKVFSNKKGVLKKKSDLITQ